MITVRTQRLKYIICDYVTANIAFLLFDIMRFYTLGHENIGYRSLAHFLTIKPLVVEQIVLPLIMMFIYLLSGFYNKPFHKSRLQEFFTSTISSGLNTLIIYFLLLTNQETSIRSTNYTVLVFMFLILLSFTYLGRNTITSITNHKIRKGNLWFNVLVAGTGETAKKFARNTITNSAKTGYRIVGFIRINNNDDIGNEFAQQYPVFNLDEIHNVCNTTDVDSIMLAPDNNDEKIILRLVSTLYPLNLPLKITPDTLSILTSNIRLQSVYEDPYIDVSTSNASESTKNVKRMLDILMSSIALIILSLPLIIIAILVRNDSKGPAFFTQERIGYRRKPFKIVKFRTMYINAEDDGPMLSSENDSRVTPLGHILRKYRIDEIPQFWNVLKGEMSLVGPRPEREYFINKIIGKAPYYSLIHQVRPGITSWGMVKYGYASTIEDMVKRMRYDLIYLANMSLTSDVKIIIYTIKTVITGRGI